MKTKLRRTLKAQVRDARVLLHESRVSLLLFVLIILGGAALFHFCYTFPGTSEHPRFSEALHATFALIFFETLLPYPEQWTLQLFFFLIPILGLVVIADGLVRFGGALTNKRSRGQKWQVAMASTFSKHVIVCGVGKVGFRVINELLHFGRDVVAIESNPAGRFVEKTHALNVPVIIADARRSTNLLKAGVDRADAIIPCTDDELANLDIALDARDLNPAIKVVMRMYDADLARRVEKGFGIQTAYSTSALAAPIFAAAAMRVNVKHSFYVGETLLNLGEVVLQANSPLVGWTVARLESELDLSVVCHQGRQVTDLHPTAEQQLEAGDKLLVLTTIDTLRQLEAMGRGESLSPGK